MSTLVSCNLNFGSLINYPYVCTFCAYFQSLRASKTKQSVTVKVAPKKIHKLDIKVNLLTQTVRGGKMTDFFFGVY